MICTLIEAADLNEEFSIRLRRLFPNTGDKAIDDFSRYLVIGSATKSIHRLREIAEIDLENGEIFSGMVEVMDKIVEWFDGGRI